MTQRQHTITAHAGSQQMGGCAGTGPAPLGADDPGICLDRLRQDSEGPLPLRREDSRSSGYEMLQQPLDPRLAEDAFFDH